MNTFPGPNFVSPEWRCYLNRGVSKERFHCILSKMVCNRVRDGTLGRSLSVREVTKNPASVSYEKSSRHFTLRNRKKYRNISQGTDTDTGLLFNKALALLCSSLSQYCRQVWLLLRRSSQRLHSHPTEMFGLKARIRGCWHWQWNGCHCKKALWIIRASQSYLVCWSQCGNAKNCSTKERG